VANKPAVEQKPVEQAAFQPGAEERFATAIANAVAQATVQVNERINPHEVRFPKPHSAFNPEGLTVRPTLTRKCYFAGGEMKQKTLKNSEILLLNQITRPGAYNGGKWRVIIRTDSGGQDRLFIELPTKSIDDRMALPRSLTEVLNQILSEQAALDVAAAQPAR
jgi:hypothetical protein